MDFDEKFLRKILEIKKSTKLDFILNVDSKTFPLKNIEISKSITPVNRPTNRGGVYFSDTFNYKLKAQVNDLSLASLISKSMLGPNDNFQDLQIQTHIKIDGSIKKVIFFVHLINSMQSSNYIEFNTIIIKIKSE